MYNRDEIKAQLLEAIERERCTTFSEAASFVAPNLATLYEWEFEKDEALKSAVASQKVKAKAKLKKNWLREDSAPVLQLAAYKLMADEDELDRLTVNKNKNEDKTEMVITWNEEKTYEA